MGKREVIKFLDGFWSNSYEMSKLTEPKSREPLDVDNFGIKMNSKLYLNNSVSIQIYKLRNVLLPIIRISIWRMFQMRNIHTNMEDEENNYYKLVLIEIVLIFVFGKSSLLSRGRGGYKTRFLCHSGRSCTFLPIKEFWLCFCLVDEP